MRLESLNLENFQGVTRAKFDFLGANANIYGDNATGKTSVYNAFTWLMFGKASTGATGFSPRPKDADGADVHNVDTSVEAVLDVDGGTVTLKKVYREKWTRQNGKTTDELTGNTTDYFIDGVAAKEKEFAAFIEAIAPTDKMRILSSPTYFSETLPWKDRREILFSLQGEVTDADVLAENPGLADLPGILGAYTVDKYKKIAEGKCKEINSELTAIPSRIDEATRAIPDLTGLSLAKLDADVKAADVEKAELMAARGSMGNAEANAKVRGEIAELTAELAEKRAAYAEKLNADNQVINAAISCNMHDGADLDQEVDYLTGEMNDSKAAVKKMLERREEIKALHAEAKAADWTGNTDCPTCGQPLPSAQIQASRERFEANRDKRIAELRDEGKKTCSNEMLAETEDKITKLAAEIAEKAERSAKLDRDNQDLRGKLRTNDFDKTEYAVQTSARIAELRELLAGDANAATAAQKRVDGQIADINAKIDAIYADKAKFEAKETREARVRQLCKREKELAGQYEELQRGLNLCADFIRAKSEMISKNVCARFKTVQFALFKNQINGGLDEICEVLVPSEAGALVPFAVANNAARINAGIEIIGALSEYWGVSLPLFVDNRESVTRLVETDTQIISLIVSENDKTLRLEADERRL